MVDLGGCLRVCDSRNLILSPFCNLTVGSLVKWQPALNLTYKSKQVGKYPSQGRSAGKAELLTSLTEVVIQHNYFIKNVFIFH